LRAGGYSPQKKLRHKAKGQLLHFDYHGGDREITWHKVPPFPSPEIKWQILPLALGPRIKVHNLHLLQKNCMKIIQLNLPRPAGNKVPESSTFPKLEKPENKVVETTTLSEPERTAEKSKVTVCHFAPGR